MHALGARRGWHKKCFYTDRHEDSKVVEYRVWYITSMNSLEYRMYHWVTISSEKRDQLLFSIPLKEEERRANFPVGVSVEGTDKVLYHMDDLDIFDNKIEYPRKLHPKFTTCFPNAGSDGPDWKRLKPDVGSWVCHESHTYESCLCHTGGLVHWGQDESVYHSKVQPKGVWIINDIMPMYPKSDGAGVMVSSYVCSELGMGAYGRTPEQLERYFSSPFFNTVIHFFL
jgi:hypothetical protein